MMFFQCLFLFWNLLHGYDQFTKFHVTFFFSSWTFLKILQTSFMNVWWIITYPTNPWKFFICSWLLFMNPSWIFKNTYDFLKIHQMFMNNLLWIIHELNSWIKLYEFIMHVHEISWSVHECSSSHEFHLVWVDGHHSRS